MNLRDLRYVVAVADTCNFSLAAERCFVSQPTLSTQLKKMEDSLGVVLFERTNRSVRVTEAGAEIVATARRILREVDHIEAVAAATHNPLAGNLRFGAFPTLASFVFPVAVERLRTALPKLRLLLIEEKTAGLLGQLRAGECDVALIALPVTDPALVAEPLFEDPFWVAVPADHRLARKRFIEPADLRDVKLLLLDEGHCLRDQALDYCFRHGGEEEPNFRATSLETLRMMVKAGTGITLLPASALREETGVRYIPFEPPAPRRLIGLVWRKTTARGHLMGRLASLLKAEFDSLFKLDGAG